jgi:hypothetical protein|tara:strand:+ start:1834 stop:2190 length:357 start_codon:yes stop_codon:yes gene_type:complete
MLPSSHKTNDILNDFFIMYQLGALTMEIIHLSPVLYETIGVIGIGLYVLNYTRLTLRYVNGNDISYFAANLLAAACVSIGLAAIFNLAAALIQIFFVGMSLLGIALSFTRPADHTPLS